MKKINLVFKPLTNDELEEISYNLLWFFAPQNYNSVCRLLRRNPGTATIPFSYGDFIDYLEENSPFGENAINYIFHISGIIGNLVHKGALNLVGFDAVGSPPLNHKYYTYIKLTKVQATNRLWLSKYLGENYLMNKLKNHVVRFEGINSNSESGTGSGVLINQCTILTCKHNITDLKEFKCYLGEEELEIKGTSVHEKHDIGIVKLSKIVDFEYFPYFGSPFELDNVITMGYPPLRGMREAALITQKGEINALCTDWGGCESITISSTVRPGNSGGPVISANGYIVGIVTQFANSASSVSVDKSEFNDNKAIPFYNAISSIGIKNNIKEIDDSFEIIFEDYK